MKLTPSLQKETRYNKTKFYIYIDIFFFIYKYIETLLGVVSDIKWYPDLSLLACSGFMRLSKAVLYLLRSPIQRSQVWQGMTNSLCKSPALQPVIKVLSADGSEIHHQLIWRIYLPSFTIFYTCQVVVWDFWTINRMNHIGPGWHGPTPMNPAPAANASNQRHCAKWLCFDVA